jgi:UDP-2,4-diacetamido-2,4,6-trideoxy-beta-L-altropyranose hydrolase
LGVDWKDDADELRARLGGETFDLLVVDHYALDARWEQTLRNVAQRFLIIDDLGDRPHDCDFLVDYSHHRNPAARYRGLVPASAQLLLGPRYAPLAARFAELANRPPRPGPVKTIGLFFGAADLGGNTAHAVEAWRRKRPAGVTLRVLLSPGNPRFAWFREQAKAEPSIEVFGLVPDPAGFFADCDSFLGAGGVSVWERAALSLPSLTIAVAENQEIACQGLVEEGLLAYLGRARDLGPADWEWAFATLYEIPKTLREKTQKLRALVDGRGLERIVREVGGAQCLALRAATSDDCRWIWEQRNDPKVRAGSFDSAEIPWEAHQKWYAAALKNPQRKLLVATADERAVGVLRFDTEGARAEVSIFLASSEMGKGWGPVVLRAGTEWVRRHLPEVRTLVARVKPENAASVAAFHAAEYEGSPPELRRAL